MISRREFLGGLAGASAGLWLNLGAPRNVHVYSGSALREGFAHPPDTARPWVYWFWANGNVTRQESPRTSRQWNGWWHWRSFDFRCRSCGAGRAGCFRQR